MNQPVLLNLLRQALTAQGACPPGDPLAGVIRPQRLQVLNPCQTVTGAVTQVFRAPDGDIHFNVRLDSPFAGLINQFNVLFWGGTMVCEIVPLDQRRVAAPSVGERVAVTGTLVIDTLHGWVEIHPVRSILVQG